MSGKQGRRSRSVVRVASDGSINRRGCLVAKAKYKYPKRIPIETWIAGSIVFHFKGEGFEDPWITRAAKEIAKTIANNYRRRKKVSK